MIKTWEVLKKSFNRITAFITITVHLITTENWELHWMLQVVWACANKSWSSWLIYIVYSDYSPKRPSRGTTGRGGRRWLNDSEAPAQRGAPGTCQGFYIFIESEVLVSCLCCPRGQATVRSWHLVFPHVGYALLPFTSTEKQKHVSHSYLCYTLDHIECIIVHMDSM